jgi:hypothetical protein
MLLTNVIVTLKNGVFYKTNGYQQIHDTNKNMIKMGMIVNRVYYT